MSYSVTVHQPDMRPLRLYIDRQTRSSQTVFRFNTCDLAVNAELNMALNILAKGHAMSARVPKMSECGEDHPLSEVLAEIDSSA